MSENCKPLQIESLELMVKAREGDRIAITRECLDFTLQLPERSLIFGFAFLYDLTKWLSDLPDRSIYLLFHEQLRAKIVDGQVHYRPVKWNPDDRAPCRGRGCPCCYRINYMNRRFSVSKGRERATIWDIFAFFQSKYTKALTDWFSLKGEGKIWALPGMGAAVERMEKMKTQRATFDKLSKEEIRVYCKEECKYLAQLGRALITAHEEAGLKLKTYFGAGSTASALLGRFGVKERRGEVPERMREPVASAFFGGRFENAVVGPIRGRVYNYDISSAYPYQATFLPCLSCGRWRHHARAGQEMALDGATCALVRWTIPIVEEGPWGVLPVRKIDGTIAFPLSAEGGWVWREEFLAARKVNPHVEVKEVWSYDTDCDHRRPFGGLPDIYRERVRIGKDARGIVLKLGPNSVYGKLAQSKGLNPPFQEWIWAGSITSGCRSQLLGGLVSAADRNATLMFATDGDWTKRVVSLESPRDTGTSDLAKPLGGWEEKIFERGVFAVRPGIYFPLAPTEEELEKVRARGLGRKALYEQWAKVVDAWEAGETGVSLKCADRFVGAKSGVRWDQKRGARRSDDYGEWIPHVVDVGFSPKPKRASVNPDGTLECWRGDGKYGQNVKFDVPSVPYDAATVSNEAALLMLAQLIAEEQPDGDFSELE